MNYMRIKMALKTISDMCNEIPNDHCGECPCGDSEGGCLLQQESPCNWNIVEKDPIVKVML